MTRLRVVGRRLRVLVLVFLGTCALATPKARAGDEPRAASPASPTSSTWALVGGEPVTEADVEALIAPQLAELRQRGYQLRSQALDELIARRVVEREAVRRGVSVEALVKAEVEEKAVPTDAERRALYEANKSRFAGQSEAEAMRQIEPAARQQKRRERQGAFIADLRAKEEVLVLLEPLRADLRLPAGVPVRGPETAPVTIVEFSDFQCPFCVRAQPTLQRLREAYGAKLRFVFLDFPLEIHPQAPKAHEAAACAGDQGKFWPMYDRLFASGGKLEVADLKTYAGELGLDGAAFGACLESGRHAPATESALQEGQRHGVTGTPAFFINGRLLVGAQPFEAFAQIIDDELSRAARRSEAAPPKPGS
jgi:protein-disulfide isomerase